MNLKKQLLTIGATAAITLSAFAGAAAQDNSSNQVDGTANLEIPVCTISNFSADQEGYKSPSSEENNFGTWQKVNGTYHLDGEAGEDNVMEFSFESDHNFRVNPPGGLETFGHGGGGGGDWDNKCDASFTANLSNANGGSIGAKNFSASFDNNDWVGPNVASNLDGGNSHNLDVQLNTIPAENAAGQYTGPVTVTLSVGE